MKHVIDRLAGSLPRVTAVFALALILLTAAPARAYALSDGEGGSETAPPAATADGGQSRGSGGTAGVANKAPLSASIFANRVSLLEQAGQAEQQNIRDKNTPLEEDGQADDENIRDKNTPLEDDDEADEENIRDKNTPLEDDDSQADGTNIRDKNTPLDDDGQKCEENIRDKNTPLDDDEENEVVNIRDQNTPLGKPGGNNQGIGGHLLALMGLALLIFTVFVATRRRKRQGQE